MLVGRVRILKRLRDSVDETSHLREPLRHNIYQRSWRQSDRGRSSATRELGVLPDLLVRFGRCLHTSLPAGTAQITEFFIRKVRDIIYYTAPCQVHVRLMTNYFSRAGSKQAQGDPDRIAMGFDRIRDLPGITTTHSGNDRNPPQPAGTEDQQVTAAEPLDGQLQLSESILLIRVDSRLVEDHRGSKIVENAWEVIGQDGQILIIAQTIGEMNIEGALFFARRKILFTVHGEGEDLRITLEDGRGAIPLVDIAIDDRKTSGQAIPLENPDSDGDVVEDTVPLSVVRVGVVGPPGEVRGKAIPYRAAGGEDRPLDRGAGAADQPL